MTKLPSGGRHDDGRRICDDSDVFDAARAASLVARNSVANYTTGSGARLSIRQYVSIRVTNHTAGSGARVSIAYLAR